MISFWTWDSLSGININLVILAVNILVFWALLIFTEMNITKLLWIKVKEVFYGSGVSTPSEVDSDVRAEKDNVFKTTNAMTVCNLTKKFGRFDAVRGLTFGVRDKVNSVYNVICELVAGMLWSTWGQWSREDDNVQNADW